MFSRSRLPKKAGWLIMFLLPILAFMGCFGVAMGWLTRKTKSIWGAVISHTLAGLAQVSN